MAKPDMRGALGSSLKAEEQTIKQRFEKRDHMPEPDRFARAEAALASPISEVTSPAPPQVPGLPPYPGTTPAQAGRQPQRVVRDSFTAPKPEYERIAILKKRCLGLGRSATKSEVLRAGLAALCAMPDEELAHLMQGLEKVKTGRPQPL